MVKVINDLVKSFRKMCDNDETTIFVVLVLLGIVLCMVFNKDGFANDVADSVKAGVESAVASVDKGLHQAVEAGEEVYGFGKDAPHSVSGKESVGLVPKPNRPSEVAPSMDTQMATLGSVKGPEPVKQQVPGQLVQDGSITKPFDEVWNPGYEPVDMAFQGAKSISKEGFQNTEDSRKSGGDVQGTAELTMYYAPWCPHCKNMMPEWSKIEKAHHGKSLMGKLMSIVKVNSDTESDKVKAADPPVQGFPDIRLNGKPLKVSERSYDGIMESVKQSL